MMTLSKQSPLARDRAGLSTPQSTSTISGIRTSTIGMPMRSHCAKPIPACAAAIALGGLPTSVPIPPMLAL